MSEKRYIIAADWNGALRDGDVPDFGVYKRGEETPIATFRHRGDARAFRAYKNEQAKKVSGR